MKTYKGFNKDFTCRGFQFEVGKTYTYEGEVKVCESGFHACEYPLDVFSYYPPASSIYAVCEQSGELAKHDTDSKVASSIITINSNLDIEGLVKEAIDFTISRTKKANNSGVRGVASNSGKCGAAANSGKCGAAANSGVKGAAANSGKCGAAANSGYQGAASNSGVRGVASNSGVRGVASNSGDQGAASNSGSWGLAANSGDYGAASNSGHQGAASNSGDYGAASNSGHHGAASTAGKESIAACFGYDNKAKASEDNWIVLVERTQDGTILNIRSAKAALEGEVKPDTWYKLINNKFIEVE